jgi:hypothetical protein
MLEPSTNHLTGQTTQALEMARILTCNPNLYSSNQAREAPAVPSLYKYTP